MRLAVIIVGVAAFICAFVLGVVPSHADKRVALVIGNKSYQNVAALGNSENDAHDMKASLARLGFVVREVINGDLQAMRRALRDFAPLAQRAEMAVVYFSGHGMEIAGENWLIPVDAELLTDIAPEQEAVSLRGIMPLVGAAKRLGLVVLDACRNNPFAGKMQRKQATKAVEKGFVRVEPTGSVLVAYAAKDGTTALDTIGGPNSPFTTALLKHIETPGLEINYLFRNVRDEVLTATRQQQEPFIYGALSREQIFLKEAPPDPAAQAWGAVKDTASIAMLEEFRRQFPGTIYAAFAGARVEELKKSQLAAGPPAPPPAAAPQPAPRPQVAVVAPPVIPATRPADPCSGPVTASLASRCAAPLTTTQERALKPKDSFRECEMCPEMVVVPKGTFTMGSRDNEPGRDKQRDRDESPQHVVKIDKPFATGRLHVTVEQFAAFVADTGYDAGSECLTYETGQYEAHPDRSWRNPGFAQVGSHPVVCLNWDDAKAYVEWLAKKTKKPYRLLTEAEFEYAARAQTSPGTYPRFWFGNDEKDLCRYGNGADQKALELDTVEGFKGRTVAPCNDGYAHTSPAGHFPANDFGLHDMFGNAWQWTADRYNDSYKGAPIDGSAWTTGFSNSRVVRGGSWNTSPSHLRVAKRNGVAADDRADYYGFRVARTLLAP